MLSGFYWYMTIHNIHISQLRTPPVHAAWIREALLAATHLPTWLAIVCVCFVCLVYVNRPIFYIITTPKVGISNCMNSPLGHSSYKESLVQQELIGWCMRTLCMFTTNIHLNCCPQIEQQLGRFYSNSQQDCYSR